MKFLKRVLGLGGETTALGAFIQPEPEQPLYVVGDIHGRDDLLARLIEQIDADIAEHDHANAQIIFVGDYIDRGDASAEVLDRLHAMDADRADVTCLIGNHEEMMLEFLDDPSSGPRWLRNGGLQTLASFRIGGITESAGEDRLADASERLREALGSEREAWMRDLGLMVRSGNVVVVHAALDPALPPEDQSDRVMTWGHPTFLHEARSDGLCVVHGHTIVDFCELRPNRVPVDTGAVFTGRLTAGVMAPGRQLRHLQS